MSFFGIGNQKRPADVAVNPASPTQRDKYLDQPAEQPAERIRTALTVSVRLTQATARVADLEERLLGARKTVEDLTARLTVPRARPQLKLQRAAKSPQVSQTWK
jgi:hypothetical protein